MPELRYQEANNKAHDDRQYTGHRGPFDTFGFLVNGVDGGATWVMQQAE